MIKVEKLIKNYGDFEAVKSIDFSINHGEIVGFLGANGAGKSTTLKILTGYLAPTSGNVIINNLNIETHSHEIKKMIGYLPESNPLYKDMFVYDLLKFTANTREIFNNDFKNAFEKSNIIPRWYRPTRHAEEDQHCIQNDLDDQERTSEILFL